MALRRFPLPSLDDLAPDAAALAAQLLVAARGSTDGPLAMLVRSPAMSARLRPLISFFARESALPKRLSELAILIQASHWRQDYEWWAHYRIGLDAGLDPGRLATLYAGNRPAEMMADEAAVYDFCRALITDGRVADAPLETLRTHLDDGQIVELVTLSGVYATLALLLNLNEEGAPPSDAPVPRPGIG